MFKVVWGAIVCLAAVVAAQAATLPSQVTRGRQVYISDGCQQCHGYSGQGTVGPRIAPNPIPLELFSRQLRNPRGVMPVYTAKVLSDADLASIYAYMNSIAQPAPVAKIPLLR